MVFTLLPGFTPGVDANNTPTIPAKKQVAPETKRAGEPALHARRRISYDVVVAGWRFRATPASRSNPAKRRIGSPRSADPRFVH